MPDPTEMLTDPADSPAQRGLGSAVTMVSPYRLAETAQLAPLDSALNWYTGSLAKALTGRGVAVSIIAPRHPRAVAEPWWDGAVRVLPSFRRGSIKTPLQIMLAALRTRGEVVHFQHELFAYGGMATAFQMPFAQALLRAQGRRVVTTIHGVIPLERINAEFIRGNAMAGTAAVVRRTWRTLLRQVALSSDIVHVHEPQHRIWLTEGYGLRGRRIEVVPLGVQLNPQRFDKKESRRRLGLRDDANVLMFFGFLAHYKGLEILIREAPRMLAETPDLQILIAGNVPKRLSSLSSGVVADLAALRARYPQRVIKTGFLADDLVGPAFCAADALVLPYTMNMAASGPLSLAVSYGLPILLSDVFSTSYGACPDLFGLAPGALAACVRRFFTSSVASDRARRFVNSLRPLMDWERVATDINRLYLDV